jgi:mRNA interferase RelE/StbE
VLRIEFLAQAKKALWRMPAPQASAIRERLARLAEKPGRRDLDVKKLKRREGYRLRVGGWRVIYVIEGDMLSVLRVAPRGEAYKE